MKNNIILKGNTVKMYCPNKKKYVLFDKSDIKLISSTNKSWLIIKPRHCFYCLISHNKSGQPVLMHRLIMQPPKNKLVDHINGNGLDNRRKNLRIVNYSENGQNRHHNIRSNERGICWNKKRKKWVGRVALNNAQEVYQKYCDTKKEARFFVRKIRKRVMPFSTHHLDGYIVVATK